MTSEIYRVTKPCNNCPFLDNGKAIMLADGRVDSIKEELLQGGSFNCHKTVYNLDDNMNETEEQELKMCAGAYQFLKKENKPNQQMQIAQRFGIKELGENNMKLYTFTDGEGNILEHVRAETHDEAVAKLTNKEAIAIQNESYFGCDFYSEDIDEE